MEENININDNDVNNSKNTNKIGIVIIFIIVLLIGFTVFMLFIKKDKEPLDSQNETNQTKEEIIKKDEEAIDNQNETAVLENLRYGTYRYDGNKTSYSSDEKKLISKLDLYVSEVSAALNMENDKYESVISNNKSNYDCSVANEGICVTRFERNTKLIGSDLEIETVLYNTIMYLYKYKNDVFKKDNKQYGEAIKKLSLCDEECTDDMKDEINLLNKNKGHIISAKEVIKYANKFYNLKLSDDAYREIKELKNQSQTDIQGIFLTELNNEDVYFVYLIEESEPDENEVSNTYYKLEKDNNNIYLYYKAIYNYFNDYLVDSEEGDVTIIYKYNGTDKVEVKENVDKLYENYPEYFTEYKLTFKDNKDGSYTFVSNEPITK